MSTAEAASSDTSAAPFRVDGWLKAAGVFFFLLSFFYFVPVVPPATMGYLEYNHLEAGILILLIALAATASRAGRDSATRNFWVLFAVAQACWLANWVISPLLGAAGSSLSTFIKDLFYLAMYCLLAIAVDLRPGLLKSELQSLRAKLAAVSSVLLIVGVFGYFALVPALTGLGSYESPYEIYAVLDGYIGLRFFVQALVSRSRSWRLIQFLLAAGFGLIMVADVLEYAYQNGIVDYNAGQTLNLVWFLYCVPMFLATRVRAGRPQVTPRVERGDWSNSLNLGPILAWSVAIPLIHLGGYGFGLLSRSSHGAREIFVLAWLIAATLGLVWQYALLRRRLGAAERARLAAERESAHLQAQLRQSQRIELLGQLSGGLAHEFGNSLFGAESFAQKILSDASRPDSRVKEEHARGLVDALAGSRDLITKFGVFGRGQDATARLVNVVDEVRETIEMLRPGISKGIRLDFHCDEEDVSTIARKQDLQQVTINLVLNARDAIGDSGFIDVHVGHGQPEESACTSCGAFITGEQVWVRVSDSGPGVADELRERIFEPLVTSKPAGKGSGLGLSIVHTIVHQLKGHIVLGEPRKAHCSFTILLPAVELDVSQPQRFSGSSMSVLIVEHDRALADAFRRNRALHDLHVNRVSSVDAAKIILAQPDRPPNTVIVGNMVDAIDVLSIVDAARKRPGIRTMLCCHRSQRRMLATQDAIDVIMEQPVDDDIFASTLLKRVRA